MFITVFDIIAEAKQMRLNNLPIHAVLACFVVQLSYAELVDLVHQQTTCIWFNSMPTVFSGPSTVVDPVPVSVTGQLF